MGLILGIAAVLIVAALSMGAISADDSSEVTIFNETFHIPDGFREVNSVNTTVSVTKTYENDNGESFTIAIFKKSNVNRLNLTNPVNKTIGGINGLYNTQRNFFEIYNESVHAFRYQTESGMVTVVSPDESLIERVLT